MVDDREDFGSTLKDIYKAMGRMEATVDAINEKIEEGKIAAKESTQERDRRLGKQDDILQQLERRQIADSQEARAVQAKMVGQIEEVQLGLQNISEKVSGQDTRLEALELPIKKAIKQREHWAYARRKLFFIGTAVVSFSWLFLEPLYKLIAEHYFSHFFSNLWN